jgi:hypothetical protein
MGANRVTEDNGEPAGAADKPLIRGTLRRQ